MHGEMKNAYKILVGKPEGKKQIGKPRCISEGNIKLLLKAWRYFPLCHCSQTGSGTHLDFYSFSIGGSLPRGIVTGL
jgi:hypothetical protein